jgi:hypothetical protein
MHMLVMRTLAITVATTALATFAPGVPARVANDVLPHQYVATLSSKAEPFRLRTNGRALFRATLDQRPHVHDATRPFKPGDPLVWRVAFTRLSSPVRAITMRAARPGRTGRRLVTLCRPCSRVAHGTLPLNGPLAIALDQAPFCYVQSPCSIAQPEQFTVYIEIATDRYPQGEIRGQLRFCSPSPTFHNRGSCSPPDYPSIAGGAR